MKRLLEFYYNIYPDNLYSNENTYYFFIDEIKYYFVPFERSIDELNKLVEVTNKLYSKRIKVHTFIKTKDDLFYVKHNNVNYVLLRVNTVESEEIDIYDILKFNYFDISNENRKTSWADRWSNTVDLYEKEITELNSEFPLLISVFDYYVGLAENAISYFNSIDLSNYDNNLYLSHKRIKLPLVYGFIYNPLLFIYDYKVRDLAEYIKEMFFNSNNNFDEILDIIDKNSVNYSDTDIKLLYARLLYPSYYFDIFNSELNGEDRERELKRIINLSVEYEQFLKEIYSDLKRRYHIQPIDWIVNN